MEQERRLQQEAAFKESLASSALSAANKAKAAAAKHYDAAQADVEKEMRTEMASMREEHAEVLAGLEKNHKAALLSAHDDMLHLEHRLRATQTSSDNFWATMEHSEAEVAIAAHTNESMAQRALEDLQDQLMASKAAQQEASEALAVEQERRLQQEAAFKEALASSALSAANKARAAAAQQDALQEDAAKKALESLSAALMASEAEFKSHVESEMAAMRADHEKALSSLERTHEAAFLSAKQTTLRLKASLRATETSHAELSAALDESSLRAANSTQANETVVMLAREEIQEHLRVSKLAKCEADKTLAAEREENRRLLSIVEVHEVLASSELKAAKRATDAASRQEALYQAAAKSTSAELSAALSSASAVREAAEAAAASRIAADMAAMHADHRKMLSSLESKHKAELLSAHHAELQLKETLYATQASNAVLSASLGKAAADGAYTAQVKESADKVAQEEMREKLRVLELAKNEADATLAAEQKARHRQEEAFKKALVALESEATTKAKETAAKQKALFEEATRHAALELSVAVESGKTARLAGEAVLEGKMVTEASAIRAEHEQMLLSLENQHKAALLLAQKAKLDLEANVHAKTAANKALAEALEISKADATNAAQTKESIRTTALGNTPQQESIPARHDTPVYLRFAPARTGVSSR